MNQFIRNSRGMSLIEIVIVFVVVAILSTFGYSQYQGYLIKSYEGEAKGMLTTLYMAEKMFHLEYKTYTSRFDSVGFKPEGTITYNIGFSGALAPPASAPQGTAGCKTLCPTSACPANFKSSWVCRDLASDAGYDKNGVSWVNQNAFLAEAHTHFAPGDPSSNVTWVIDQNGSIRRLAVSN